MRLRVVSGEYGSRFIDAPAGSTTHPMGERIRGALFNALGDLSGKTVLDPFSGSGAVSIEAISRGAASAIALERDRRAQSSIEKNIKALGLQGKIKLIKTNCRIWSEQHQNQQFDLILCDPPYDDLQLSTIALLIRHLKPKGLMVLSYPGRESTPTVNGVVVVDDKRYGDAALAFYRHDASE